MRVLALLASGFEDFEAMGTITLLRRAKIEVILCSVENMYRVTGNNGTNIEVDIKIQNVDKSEYDVLFLPGGMPGVDNLYNEQLVLDLVEFFVRENKLIAAICAAPSIIGKLGLLNNKIFTCFPGFEVHGSNGNYKDEGVIVDGNLITGRSVGNVIEFSKAIISKVKGEEFSNNVMKGFYF